MVIPAHPLALDAAGRLDLRHMRALTRYYLTAGAGGLAVGVHTTQFAIRDATVDLYGRVLALVAQTAAEWSSEERRPEPFLIAGVCGPTAQALREAGLAGDLGYHAALLSLGGLDGEDRDLLGHCRAVAEVMPLMGFYLQPAVGGRTLSFDFWRAFAEIDNVVGIKIAPFHRYRTHDVLRAVAWSGRADEIACYTGNDDHIVLDLLCPVPVATHDGPVEMRICGGLLGHWAVWTRRAVQILARCHASVEGSLDPSLLRLAGAVTEMNAAVFDADNGFAGCIPGIHHVLAGQGLLTSERCLRRDEVLSPGQADRIATVRRLYGELTDDDFVAAHLAEWLA